MQITNKLGLPDPMVRAIAAISARYVRHPQDAFTVTELTKPPYLIRLLRDHKDEIESDASDRLWSVFGSATHAILEAGSDNDKTAAECRFRATIAGYQISGAADLWVPDEGLLQDYKTTSVWSWILDNQGKRQEWVDQLNFLAALARAQGYPISKLENVLIFRDWQPSKAARDRQYPQDRVCVVSQDVWPDEAARAVIAQRAAARQAALDARSIEDVIPCSHTERWEKPGKWALMKEGRKSAIKLYDSEEDAQVALEEVQSAAITGKQLSIIHRPGARTRCDDYCDVSPWCPDYQRYIVETGGGDAHL